MLIFLSFLWTGSAYITWLYRLIDMFGNAQADWLSEVIGYVFQAAGILLLALLYRSKPSLIRTPHFMTCILLLDGLMMVVAITSSSKLAILLFGFIMNFLHGIIAGIYLTRLAEHVDNNKIGTVFGIAYGLGSIGSWLISLPMDKSFLHTQYALVVYIVLIILTIFVNYRGYVERASDATNEPIVLNGGEYALLAVLILLLSVVKGLGFYFPMSEPTSGAINLEFSRAFYAVGLVVAGIIGDRSRKYGSICCLAALVFPFLSLALRGADGASTLLWILGYVFFGFFSVYRILIYSDISSQESGLLWIAGFGLMFGRLGDATGALGGILLKNNDIALLVLSTLLFVVTIFIFFAVYHNLYMPIPQLYRTEEQLISDFEYMHGLSAREGAVLQLIMKGCSNGEIARELFISESTVKFHVKNVLKKTACSNRAELIAKCRALV